MMSIKEQLPPGLEPIYLIDGSSLFYRSFYAKSGLKRSDGFPTNAIYGVLRVLIRLLRDENPQYVFFF